MDMVVKSDTIRRVATVVGAIMVATACHHGGEGVELSTAMRFGMSVESRSAIVDNASLSDDDICIIATQSNGLTATRIFDRTRLYYYTSEAVWRYDTPRYWVSGVSYCFMALYPYYDEEHDIFAFNAGGTTIDDNVPRVVSPELTITDNSTGASPDILYGVVTRDCTVDNDFSPVDMALHHALAAVELRLRNAATSTITSISNVNLYGLYNKGTLTLDGSAAEPLSWAVRGITTDEDGVAVFDENEKLAVGDQGYYRASCPLPTGGMPVDVTYLHNLFADEAGENGTLFVVPQPTSKRPITLDFTYTTPSTTKDISVVIAGSATGETWEAGKRYIYDITLNNNDIEFNITIVDWIEDNVALN